MSAPNQFVLSVHDVAPPHRERVDRILDLLTTIGVPRRSLLVVPNYHGQSRIDQDHEFSSWLRHRQDEGDEIVLHGYDHLDARPPRDRSERFKHRWFTRGEGEFLSLSYWEARDRIARGRTLLTEAGIRAEGFVAPSWLINEDGMQAARDLGFQYTNSYQRFTDLAAGHSHWAPSLVFGPGHLNEDVGIGLQRLLSPVLARYRIARVILHPPCIDHAGRLAQVVSMIRDQLRHHQPVTYMDLLAGLRSSPLSGVRRFAQ